MFFGDEVCEFFRLSGLLNLVKLLRNVGFYLFKGFTVFEYVIIFKNLIQNFFLKLVLNYSYCFFFETRQDFINALIKNVIFLIANSIKVNPRNHVFRYVQFLVFFNLFFFIFIIVEWVVEDVGVQGMKRILCFLLFRRFVGRRLFLRT